MGHVILSVHDLQISYIDLITEYDTDIIAPAIPGGRQGPLLQHFPVRGPVRPNDVSISW